MKPFVSVIIPTLGTSTQLASLIESLRTQSRFADMEVLIVENSMNELIKEKLLKEISFSEKVRLISAPKKGVNTARNLGLDSSLGEVCFFIDDDCWLHDSFLIDKHLQLHEKLKEVFAIGGTYSLDDSDSGFLDLCYYSNQMRWLQRGSTGMNGNETRYLIGGHFSVKKNVVTSNKLRFDEKILYGGSELSFFLKAHQNGLKMLLEDLTVVHKTRESFGSVSRKLFKQGRGKAYLNESLDYGDPFLEASQSKRNWSESAFSIYMSLVFWFGYHIERRDLKSFAIQITRTLINRIRYQRFQLLKKAEQKIQKKLDRGDRL